MRDNRKHSQQDGPEHCSGLFLVLVIAVVATAAPDGPAVSLMGAFFPGSETYKTLAALSAYDTSWGACGEIDAAYDDLYHSRTTCADGSVRNESVAESFRYGGHARLHSPHGAVAASWRDAAAFIQDYHSENPYRYTGSATLRDVQLGLMLRMRPWRIMAGAGGTPGRISIESRQTFPAGVTSMVTVPPENTWFVSLDGEFDRWYGRMYSLKCLLPAIDVQVASTTGTQDALFSSAGSWRATGVCVGARPPFGSIEVQWSGFNLAGDTASAQGQSLPLALDGNGQRGSLRVSGDSVGFRPRLDLSGGTLAWSLLGYDAKGGQVFARADSNTAWFAAGSLCAAFPWDISAGLTGEVFQSGNNRAGRVDPYPFSAMTLFDPVKLRLDSLHLRYWSGGAFAKGSILFMKFHRVDLSASLSRVRMITFTDTREYHFLLGIIPALDDDRTRTAVIDEDVMLLAPILSYTLTIGGVCATAGVRQMVPWRIRRRTAETSTGADDGSTSYARGGTRYEIKIGYQR